MVTASQRTRAPGRAQVRRAQVRRGQVPRGGLGEVGLSAYGFGGPALRRDDRPDGQTAWSVGRQAVALAQRAVGRGRLARGALGREQVQVAGGLQRGAKRLGGGSRRRVCGAGRHRCTGPHRRTGPAGFELGPPGDREHGRKGAVVPGWRPGQRARTARAGPTFGTIDHTAAGTDHVSPGYLPESPERPSGPGTILAASTEPSSSVSSRPVAPQTMSSSRRKKGTAR